MNIAIIVAAGLGRRMQADKNKVFLNLIDKPIIHHTLKQFENHELIDDIIIVTNEISIMQEFCKDFKKIRKIVAGGKERQDSVHNGIKAIENANRDDIILIHNGANPFVSKQTITDTINAAEQHGAAVAALPAKDTIKQVKDDFVEKTLDRNTLWHMQTPQAMKYSIALEAFEKADGYATDDVALAEKLGHKVKIVESNQENFKLTTPADLALAESILTNKRIGFGHDSHRFTDNKQLVLGGVTIPDHNGLEANSDGDVVLHALFNSISSSIGKGSISHYADEMCKKGIKDSKEYLKAVHNLLKETNSKINNISISIECKTPKIEPHVDSMKKTIAEILNINQNQIGITATSGEELSDFGRGLGIQVFAVSTVVKDDS